MPIKQITITINGPYEVSGSVSLQKQEMLADANAVPFEWSKEISVDADEEPYYLCRCGHSNNKPFCDNSHLRVGFDGTETAENRPFLDMANTHSGPDLVLKEVVSLCASARFCVRAGGIRQLIQNPFGSAAREIAIKEAADCPSGRLRIWDSKTGEDLEPKFDPSITVAQDPSRQVSGPLFVKGGIELISENGTVYENRNRMTLCRCGQSQNKPFCDGSHIRVGFNDAD
jgi:CDGSH-type Zn-finger protein